MQLRCYDSEAELIGDDEEPHRDDSQSGQHHQVQHLVLVLKQNLIKEKFDVKAEVEEEGR